MKAKAFFIALMLGHAAAIGAFQNEPTGFRGFQWGDSYESHESALSQMTGTGPTKFYARIGDKMEIGGAALERITYVFYKDQLAGVQIAAKGGANGRALRAALDEQFGQGSRPNRFMDKWLWYGPIAFIVLECELIRDQCLAQISSMKSLRVQAEDDKAKAASGTKDF